MRLLLSLACCGVIVAPGAVLAQGVAKPTPPPATPTQRPAEPVLAPLPTVAPTKPAPPPVISGSPPAAESAAPAPVLATPTTVAPVLVPEDKNGGKTAETVGAVVGGVVGGVAGAAAAGPVGKVAGGFVGKRLAKGLLGKDDDKVPNVKAIPADVAAAEAAAKTADGKVAQAEPSAKPR